jgi:hypothetical protein
MWRMLLVLGHDHSLAASSLIAPASATRQSCLISDFLLLKVPATLPVIYVLSYSPTIYAAGVKSSTEIGNPTKAR